MTLDKLVIAGEWLISIMNSAFAIGIISAFAGALAGALGAQRIAERSKRKSDLLGELRNTNAAITLAFTTCNAALAIKRQHVTPMFTTYSEQKNRALEAIDMAAKGLGPTAHRLEADLKLFAPPETPIDSIKQILFSSISVHGRAIALVAVLDQSVAGLKESLMLRKGQAERLHALEASDLAFYELYFGFKNARGSTNQIYSDTVDAIKSYTDDIAFFSALLTDDLISHGNKLHAKLKKEFKTGSPRVSTVDYTRPRELGLIPPEAEYVDWLSAFTEMETKGEGK